MDKIKLNQAARQWMDDWNNRDIEQIMAHYADDIIFYSPAVVKRWDEAGGKLVGKEAVKKHFLKGMEDMPQTKFEFHSMLFGVEGIVLVYTRETGLLAADVVLFNHQGKVKEVRCYYSESV